MNTKKNAKENINERKLKNIESKMKMGAKTHQWRRRFQRSKWNRQRQTKSASSYLRRSTSPPQHFSTASPCYLVNSLPLLPLALFYTSLYMSIIQLHDQVTKTCTNFYMISAFSSSRANSASIFFNRRSERALRRTPVRQHSF